MLSNNNNEIPVGYRRDAFLYLDEEAFGSQPGPEAANFQPVKISLKHIAPTLFARLIQRDLQGEARQKPYRHTSELSRLHAATALDVRYGGDGIWPPPSRLQ
ncbi:hypothetical protein BDW72DRAFT_196626 [Aspergillus terricola var. indicus]